MYRLDETIQAGKDYETAERAGRREKLNEILVVLERDPYEPSQGFERLGNNLKGYCSRKIDKKNRILYKVLPNYEGAKDDNGNLYDGIVHVYRAWEHIYKKPIQQ